jgi:hypothetical protein
MRKIPLTPIRPTASPEEKLKWLIDAVQSIGRGSHIPESTDGIDGISAFIQTLLDDADAEEAQATLEITDDQIALKAAVYN